MLLQDEFQVPNPKICPTFYTNKTWTCFEDVFHELDFVDALLIASFCCFLTAPSPGRRFQYWTPWVCRNVASSNSTTCRNDVFFSILWYVKSATLIHCNPLAFVAVHCSCYWLAWLGIRPWLLLELCSKSPGKAADASFLDRKARRATETRRSWWIALLVVKCHELYGTLRLWRWQRSVLFSFCLFFSTAFAIFWFCFCFVSTPMVPAQVVGFSKKRPRILH